MDIDAKLVRHVARLGRLELDATEVEHYGKQLTAILGYIDQLKEVDVKGTEPLAHAGDFANRPRSDVVAPSLLRESALGNAPERSGDFFVVPKVIAEP